MRRVTLGRNSPRFPKELIDGCKNAASVFPECADAIISTSLLVPTAASAAACKAVADGSASLSQRRGWHKLLERTACSDFR